MPRLALVATLLLSCGPEPIVDPPTSRSEQYIRDDTHTRWVFEVDAVGARALRPDTAAAVVDVLSGLVDKPDGIAFVADGRLEGQLLWDTESLQTVAEQSFDDAQPAGTITTHLMLLDGSSPDGSALAVAWEQTHIALFTDVLLGFCDTGGGGQGERVCDAAEIGTLTHEIGHVLGLVNLGAPMQQDHEDPEHPAHDVNPDCIMYWEYEREGMVGHAQSELPALGFDTDCQDDIEAIRVSR